MGSNEQAVVNHWLPFFETGLGPQDRACLVQLYDLEVYGMVVPAELIVRALFKAEKLDLSNESAAKILKALGKPGLHQLFPVS